MKTYRDKSNNEASPLVRRTRDGSREMVAKNLDLSSEQRKILLHANGRRTVDEIAGVVSQLRANPDLLFDLESAGLVELFVPEEGLPLPRELVAAPRAESRPMEPTADLQPLKARLAEQLTAVLGAESGPAVQKVQAAPSVEELQQMLPKLTELVKLYAGAAASERFAAKFTR